MNTTSRIAHLQANLGGTKAELQAFVASLKGRSAAEAMGTMARSRLGMAMAISLVVQAAILAVSAIPYAMRSPDAPASDARSVSQAPAAAGTDTRPGVSPSPALPVQATPTKRADPTDTSRPLRPATSMDDLDIDRLIQ